MKAKKLIWCFCFLLLLQSGCRSTGSFYFLNKPSQPLSTGISAYQHTSFGPEQTIAAQPKKQELLPEKIRTSASSKPALPPEKVIPINQTLTGKKGIKKTREQLLSGNYYQQFPSTGSKVKHIKPAEKKSTRFTNNPAADATPGFSDLVVFLLILGAVIGVIYLLIKLLILLGPIAIGAFLLALFLLVIYFYYRDVD